MAKNFTAKKVEMALVGIEQHLAFSRDDVWAFYTLTTEKFDFLDHAAKNAAATKIDRAISSLVTSQAKSEECMLIVTSSPLNVEKWARDWSEKTAPWNPTDGYHEWIYEMKQELGRSYFSQKEVFLGVLVGRRSAYRNGGTAVPGAGADLKSIVKSAFESITQGVGSFIGVGGYEVSNEEREYWMTKSKDISTTLMSGHLRAQPVTADKIAEMFKRPLYPAMPMPDLIVKDQTKWGAGELSTLKESYIEKHRKFLRIVQEDELGNEMEGYRATLCFAKFPDVVDFPYTEPWIHFAAMLGQHFDIYSRFTLEPSQKVKKSVSQKIKEINDEATNAAQAGNIPLTLQERHQVATDLEFELSNSNDPWVFGRHRIVVTASTEQELRERVSTVVQHYANLDIGLVWTTGDQFELLQESQPADKVRVPAFLQRQSLSVISGGMPTANSTVGD